ncbi:heme-binding protein [Thiomonas intermedia]|uniref:heme-binding protein n=1 Tax=Thiomonas intermedia TaxID=926 RepID=UPI001C54EB7F|nr:heme-binding protein [Thiomonas intermedia]
MKMDVKTMTDLRVGGRRLYTAVANDPELGPLNLLPGKWVSKGRGWNMIALPFAATGAAPFRLLLNQYDEELNFTLVDKAVPNRGITDGAPRAEKDQFVVTLDYEQEIRQVASVDSPVSGKAGDPGLAIHHEPGLWLYMTNHVENEIDVGRLATIPHGNSVLALGTSDLLEKPDTATLIPDISGLPIGIGNTDIDDPNNRYLGPYKRFHDAPFKGTAAAVPGFPGFDPVAPNGLLKLALDGLEVKRTTVLSVDTATQTGGIVNIPFIVQQADAQRMVATFWIHELDQCSKDKKEGKSPYVLQYLQEVALDFLPRTDGTPGLIRWPHISINTLDKVWQ